MRLCKHKLCSAWSGPHRIVDVRSDHVFNVEDFIQMNREAVHFQKMHPYPAHNPTHAVAHELILQAEYLSVGTEMVDGIKEVPVRDGDYETLIKRD